MIVPKQVCLHCANLVFQLIFDLKEVDFFLFQIDFKQKIN